MNGRRASLGLMRMLVIRVVMVVWDIQRIPSTSVPMRLQTFHRFIVPGQWPGVCHRRGGGAHQWSVAMLVPTDYMIQGNIRQLRVTGSVYVGICIAAAQRHT